MSNVQAKITEELLRQYRTVQMSGVVNMFDRNAVQYYAFQVGMYELVNLIDEYGRQGYAELLKAYDENVEPYEDKVLKLRNEYL